MCISRPPSVRYIIRRVFPYFITRANKGQWHSTYVILSVEFFPILQNPFYALYPTTLLRFVCITQPVHTLIPSAKDTPVRTQIIAPEKERGHQPITASDHNPMHKLANFYKPLLLYQKYSSKNRKNTSAFTNIFCTLVCCIRESTYTYTNINGMTEGFYCSPLYRKKAEGFMFPLLVLVHPCCSSSAFSSFLYL